MCVADGGASTRPIAARLMVLLMLLLSLSGCGQPGAMPAALSFKGTVMRPQGTLPEDSTARRIVGPPTNEPINSMAWLRGGQLVVAAKDTLWYRATDDSGWKQLPIASDPFCGGYGYSFLTALPDGRLGMLCSARTNTPAIAWVMVAYDWSSGTLSLLQSDPLPNSGQFSWNADMSRGIFATVGQYSTLYWLTPAGPQLVPLTLTKGAQTWSLPESAATFAAFVSPSGPPLSEFRMLGLVRDPAWSPDGKVIAFWATLETIGQVPGLPVVPWDLYLMDPDSLQVRRVLEGVIDPAGLLWSPDGASLLYYAEQGGGQSAELHLFSPRTHKRQTFPGTFTTAAISPNGRLVAARCLDDLCRTTRLDAFPDLLRGRSK